MDKLPGATQNESLCQEEVHPPPPPPDARGQTGPRLPSGKAVSRHNATKHGIVSQERFINKGAGAEDPEEYRELLAELRQMHMPESPRQHDLVERIAFLTWRLRRIERFEIGAIHQRIEAEPDPCALKAVQLDERIADSQRRIVAFKETLALLRDAPELTQVTFDTLRKVAAEYMLLSGPTPTAVDAVRLAGGLSSKPDSTPEQLRQEVLETYQRLVKRETASLADFQVRRDRADRQAELRAERERLLYAIPEAHDAKLVIRYETMLTHKLDEAVAQLDRLQAREQDYG